MSQTMPRTRRDHLPRRSLSSLNHVPRQRVCCCPLPLSWLEAREANCVVEAISESATYRSPKRPSRLAPLLLHKYISMLDLMGFSADADADREGLGLGLVRGRVFADARCCTSRHLPTPSHGLPQRCDPKTDPRGPASWRSDPGTALARHTLCEREPSHPSLSGRGSPRVVVASLLLKLDTPSHPIFPYPHGPPDPASQTRPSIGASKRDRRFFNGSDSCDGRG